MASRNKKGRIHGIFKSEFQISFFHKPAMEETDVYYYIVLEDTIFIKMRFLFDVVLVIDEIYPLTMSYVESYYERLFRLLKSQTSVTVVVSLVGNTIAFRQTCIKFETPIVEKEEFLDCSMQFYNKFKNYSRNDPTYYGFYLIALKDETFSMIENAQTGVVQEEPQEEQVTEKQSEPPAPQPTPVQASPKEEPAPKPEETPVLENIPQWLQAFMQWVKSTRQEEVAVIVPEKVGGDYNVTIGKNQILMNVPKGGVGIMVDTSPLTSGTFDKMRLITLLGDFSNAASAMLTIYVSEHDVMYNVLNDDPDWQEFPGYGRPNIKFVHKW